MLYCMHCAWPDGFYDECKRRYSVKLWSNIIHIFNMLPFAATISQRIFCVHGGSSAVTNACMKRHLLTPAHTFNMLNTAEAFFPYRITPPYNTLSSVANATLSPPLAPLYHVVLDMVHRSVPGAENHGFRARDRTTDRHPRLRRCM